MAQYEDGRQGLNEEYLLLSVLKLIFTTFCLFVIKIQIILNLSGLDFLLIDEFQQNGRYFERSVIFP